jgi:hypothetical protein
MVTRLRTSVVALFCLCAGLLPAQTPDPAQLVRDAVANEVQATTHPSDSYMYRLSKESKSGLQVKDMIETPTGIVARLISLNGRPLTDAERAADDQRLNTLISSPSEQQRKRDDQKKEQDRFLAIIKAMPDALLYTYDGTEQINGRETIRLRFKPNPAFHTTTRETIIFRAAEGLVYIDAKEKRLLKFDGTQTSDINVGWGLIGHINKGSKLLLEQRRFGDGAWRLTHMDLAGNGQVLLFKSINFMAKQSATDFRRVPDNLTIAQAIDLLKKQEVASTSTPH